MKYFIKFSLLTFFVIANFANANGNYSLRVNLKNQVVEVLHNDILLKTIPCSTGMKPGSTPTGKFKTFARKEMDTWVEEDSTKINYYYITKFNNSVAFHSLLEGEHPFVLEGNNLFEARKPSSMGCVRLKKEDAKWIYSLPLGTAVEVVLSHRCDGVYNFG